ncbi:hypothetical protein PVAP13_5KG386114 [Panicum virgatum]|uniref:Uncharacterized protein n=1 Tax=Panicum virgatum TaxID=38727 RepID=A0A8T0SRI5_PANVG|nr:hypothetical protein PVAP13_5KG386114 [Panicum virgatum]
MCIVKETDLLSELFDSGLDITEMVTLSKRIRKSAYNLTLYEGLESAAAAGALVGLAKEAKFLCYVLSREDRCWHRDYSSCHAIRRETATALDMLLQESSSETSYDGSTSWALAVVKSERPQGTVGDLYYASDDADVNAASAGAKSEKPQLGVSTAGACTALLMMVM